MALSFLTSNSSIFTFNIRFAEFLYAIRIVGHFVDKSRHVVYIYIGLLDIFVIKLKIGEI